ncbi:hypothetical protein GCM10011594_43920 [Nakamurella endophytica]|uniref:Methyltransferase domain-containing protein n=2 Tax=Nakamurella endophytica TaxID=1748367 RepID=A0A917WPP4_9ACTN|nr:hypothetical protein GCM10011594_43920 [Nakamurella endophytica]
MHPHGTVVPEGCWSRVAGAVHVRSRTGRGRRRPAKRSRGPHGVHPRCWQGGPAPIDLRWDHNAWYHGRLLRALPAGAEEVLEVGCGAGSFAACLATHTGHVDAIDRSPHMVALARQRAGWPP